jgi:hypothetical protein
MALNYSLSICSELEPLEVLTAILNETNLGINFNNDTINDGISATGDGISVHTSKIGIESKAILKEELGISQDISIIFRLDRHERWKSSRNIMLQAVSAILNNFPGDAALLFNSENVILLRRSGRITLNTGLGFWTDDCIEILNINHEMDDIPSF